LLGLYLRVSFKNYGYGLGGLGIDSK
jgi:hypothetical protein